MVKITKIEYGITSKDIKKQKRLEDKKKFKDKNRHFGFSKKAARKFKKTETFAKYHGW